MLKGEAVKTLERLFLFLCIFSIPLFRSLDAIFLVASSFLFLTRHLAERNCKKVLFAKDPRLGFLALAGAATLSAIFAQRPLLAFRGSTDFLKMYAIYVIIVSDFSDKNSIRVILLTVIASTAIGSVWGLTEYLTGQNKYVELRAVGFTNHSAIYLGISLLVAFYYFSAYLKGSNLLEKILVTSGSAVIMFALLLSSTRTLLSNGRLLFILFALFYVGKKRALKVALLLGVVLLFLIILFPVRANNKSLSDRLELWSWTWEVYKSNPVVGVGANHLKFQNPELYHLPSTHQWSSHAHNLFFNILSQLGTVGFLSLLLLFFLIFKSLPYTQPSIKPLVITTLISVLIISFVNTTLHSQHGRLFSLIIAMAGNIKEPEEKVES